MKLKEIAERLGVELHGDGDTDIEGVNRIEDAGVGELAFLANPRYRKHLDTATAGAVILAEKAKGCRLNQLVTANPAYAFAQVLRLFYPPPGQNLPAGIAATAAVAETATLGKEAHVGHFACLGENTAIGDYSKIMAGAYIGSECKVGANCLIYPNVTVYDGTVIGDNVTIHAGSVIGSDGFGFAQHEGVHHKIYQVGSVRIEDDVEIGANCTIDRAALAETVIGRGTKIDNLVQIAHNVRTGRGCIIVSQVGVSGSTKLGDYVTLAGQVGLVGHIEIGDRAILGAQAGVPKSIPADGIYAGSPARELREFKLIEAHVHRLPQKMKLLQQLEARVAQLEEKLAHLEDK